MLWVYCNETRYFSRRRRLQSTWEHARGYLPWPRPSGWPTRLLGAGTVPGFPWNWAWRATWRVVVKWRVVLGTNGGREAAKATDEQSWWALSTRLQWVAVQSHAVAFVRSIPPIETAITKAEHHEWFIAWIEERAAATPGVSQEEERELSVCLSVQNHTRSGCVYWMDSLCLLQYFIFFPSSSSRSCTEQFTGSLFEPESYIYILKNTKVLTSSFLRIFNRHNLTKI